MNSPDDLLEAAKRVQPYAHCPYSRYPVAAALRSNNGRIFTGVNVENASYGLTICAERHAIGAMVAAGGRQWTELAVLTQDGGSPCGACRQVLAEFAAPRAIVWCIAATGEAVRLEFADLLPRAFGFAPPETRVGSDPS
jgi:cytidine deaminase